MRLRACADDGKADARSGRAARAVRAPETVKYTRELLRRNAAAIILHAKDSVARFPGQADRHRSSLPAIADGIVDQIDDQPHQHGAVSRHGAAAQRSLKGDMLFLRNGQHVFRCAGGNLLQIKPVVHGKLSRVHSRDHQQIADERMHLLALLQHAGDSLVLFRHVRTAERIFRLRAHGIERRAQLMRSIRGELALAFEGRLQSAEHLIQRIRQRMELIPPACRHVDALRQIPSMRNRRSQLRHVLHRTKSARRNQIAAQQRSGGQQRQKPCAVIRDRAICVRMDVCRRMQAQPGLFHARHGEQRIENEPSVSVLFNALNSAVLKRCIHAQPAVNQASIMLKQRRIDIGKVLQIRINLHHAMLDLHLVHEHHRCAAQNAAAVSPCSVLRNPDENHDRCPADHQQQRRIPQRDTRLNRL